VKIVLKQLLFRETTVLWNLFWFNSQMCLCTRFLILACKTFHCSLALYAASPGSVFLNGVVILPDTPFIKGISVFVYGKSVVQN